MSDQSSSYSILHALLVLHAAGSALPLLTWSMPMRGSCLINDTTACEPQTLRLDGRAAQNLIDEHLTIISSLGNRLQQLALIGLQHVSDDSLIAALGQLPMLQV